MVVPPDALGTWQLEVAARKGYFQQQGLAVERSQEPIGRIAEALESSGREVALVTTEALVRAVADGRDLAMVAGAVNRAAFTLVLAKGVEDAGGLAGKVVGVRDTAGVTAVLARRMLRRQGLGEADYRLFGFAEPALLAAAVVNQTAGGSLLDTVQASRLEVGGFKPLGRAFEAVPEFQAEGLVVRREWAGQNEDRLVRLLRAVVQANRWTYAPANRREAVEILASTARLAGGEADEVYERYVVQAPAVPREGEIEEAGVQTVLDLLAEADPELARPERAALVDTTYVSRAR